MYLTYRSPATPYKTQDKHTPCPPPGPSQLSLPRNFECFCQRREATSNKNLRRKRIFRQIKMHTKCILKSVIYHVTTKNQNLRRIDIGSLKYVKMVTITNFGFKLIQQSSTISVIQNSEQNIRRTEFQFFKLTAPTSTFLSHATGQNSNSPPTFANRKPL